jgi:hypothetical protein
VKTTKELDEATDEGETTESRRCGRHARYEDTEHDKRKKRAQAEEASGGRKEEKKIAASPPWWSESTPTPRGGGWWKQRREETRGIVINTPKRHLKTNTAKTNRNKRGKLLQWGPKAALMTSEKKRGEDRRRREGARPLGTVKAAGGDAKICVAPPNKTRGAPLKETPTGRERREGKNKKNQRMRRRGGTKEVDKATKKKEAS